YDLQIEFLKKVERRTDVLLIHLGKRLVESHQADRRTPAEIRASGPPVRCQSIADAIQLQERGRDRQIKRRLCFAARGMAHDLAELRTLPIAVLHFDVITEISAVIRQPLQLPIARGFSQLPVEIIK